MSTSKRRGYTLGELMMVIPTSVILAGIAVHSWIELMPLPEKCSEHAQKNFALATLTQQFRQDAHLASKVTTAGDQQPPAGQQLKELKLEFAGSRPSVTYRVEGDSLWREVLQDGQPGTQHERYTLPGSKIAGLDVQALGDRQLVSLIVETLERPAWRVEAELGSTSFAGK